MCQKWWNIVIWVECQIRMHVMKWVERAVGLVGCRVWSEVLKLGWFIHKIRSMKWKACDWCDQGVEALKFFEAFGRIDVKWWEDADWSFFQRIEALSCGLLLKCRHSFHAWGLTAEWQLIRWSSKLHFYVSFIALKDFLKLIWRYGTKFCNYASN